VHHNPKEALSDGHQSLSPDEFGKLMADLHVFVDAANCKM